jgi:YD repeat-containing protein
MIYRNILLVLFTFFYAKAFGQSFPPDYYSYLPNTDRQFNKYTTSPEVYGFQLVNLIPADLSTGRLNLSIPIYEIEDGDIKVPVSISYNSTGINVNESSGNAGMNWVLNAGGNISVITRDIDDHSYTTSEVMQQCGDITMPEQCLLGEFLERAGKLVDRNNIQIVKGSFTNNFGFVEEDAQHDLFVGSAPGLRTEFITHSNNGNYTAINKILDNSKINVNGYATFDINSHTNLMWFGASTIYKNISPANQVASRLQYLENWHRENSFERLKKHAKDYVSFSVVNNKGVKYDFGTYDVNTSITTYNAIGKPYMDLSRRSPLLLPPELKHSEVNYRIKKDVWHLDKIESYDGTHKIQFRYKAFVNSHIKKIPNNFYNNPNSLDSEMSGEMLMQNTVSNYIDEIQWSEGKLKFFYETARQDLPNGYALSKIVLQDLNGNSIKEFRFNYDYYESVVDAVNATITKRLRLRSVETYDVSGAKSDTHFFAYNSNILPALYSHYEQDCFGYYKSINKSEIKLPLKGSTVYEYPNNRYTWLPFKLAGYTYTQVGIDRSVSNDDAAIGLLQTYTTPTGSVHNFEYEANRFDVNGEVILGGGVRIKKQTITDRGNNVRTLSYDYSDDQGKASGTIAGFPQIYSIIDYDTYTTSQNIIYRFSSFNMARGELTNGSYVSYRQVAEIEAGNGKTVYSYTSNQEYPNEYPAVVSGNAQTKFKSFGSFNDLSFARGYLYNKRVYSESGSEILSEKTDFIVTRRLISDENYKKRILRYQLNSPNTLYSTVFKIPEYSYELKKLGTERTTNFGLEKNLNEKTLYSYNNIAVSNTAPIPRFYDITQGSESQSSDKFFLRSEESENSNGKKAKREYFYPSDFLGGSQGEYMSTLLNVNRVSEQVSVREKAGENYVFELVNEYKKFNNIVRKCAVHRRSGLGINILNSSDRYLVYNNYDSYGNVIQYTLRDQSPVTIIWGYGGHYPVAEIKNAAFTEVVTALGGTASANTVFANLNSATVTETYIRTTVNAIRNHATMKKALVSTYSYRPLMGVSGITDPTGRTTYYDYDGSGRLQTVKDTQQKTKETFNYNYRNQ